MAVGGCGGAGAAAQQQGLQPVAARRALFRVRKSNAWRCCIALHELPEMHAAL